MGVAGLIFYTDSEYIKSDQKVIYLSKIDRTMGAIELSLEKPKSMYSSKRIWIASIDGVNSEMDRKYSAELHLFNIMSGVKEGRLKLQTPSSLFLTRGSFLIKVEGSKLIFESEVDLPFFGDFRIKMSTKLQIQEVWI
jgi:hypothetical protein